MVGRYINSVTLKEEGDYVDDYTDPLNILSERAPRAQINELLYEIMEVDTKPSPKITITTLIVSVRSAIEI